MAGEIIARVGGVELQFPANTPREVIDKAVKKYVASRNDSGSGQKSPASPVPPTTPDALDNRRLVDKVLRPAEFAASGFSDAVINSVGAVPDLIGAGMRAARIPGAPDPGAYTDAMRRGYNATGEFISRPINKALGYRDDQGELTDVGGPAQPTGEFEKIAQGVGEGTGLAASFMIPGAALARTAGTGTTLANVGRAMSSQPVLQTVAGGVGGGVTEATQNPYAGMAAALMTGFSPSLVPALAKKAITPFQTQLNQNEKLLANAAQAEGIRLTAGQLKGSKFLRTMENVFLDTPFTGSSQRKIYEAQRKAFNEATLKKAGVSGDSVAPEILEDAFTSIGREFDTLAKQTKVTPDRKLFDDIAETQNEHLRRMPTDQSKVMQSYIDDWKALYDKVVAGGSPIIRGEEVQKISSALKARARSAPDKGLRDGLYSFARNLDDAVGRSAGVEVKEAWKNVRRRYRNLLTVDSAAGAGSAIDRAAGNVPFSGLRAAAKSSDPGGYARGRGDLNQTSRIGDFLASATPPNSGTAPRNFINKLLTFGGPGAAGAGVGYAASGQAPAAAILAMAAALGGPKLVQAAYNNRAVQAYLKNQLIKAGKSPTSYDDIDYTPLNILAAQEQLFAPEDSLQIEIRPPAGTR